MKPRKPRRYEKFLFSVSCGTLKDAKYCAERYVCISLNSGKGYETWELSELNSFIQHLLKCRDWLEEREKTTGREHISKTTAEVVDE